MQPRLQFGQLFTYGGIAFMLFGDLCWQILSPHECCPGSHALHSVELQIDMPDVQQVLYTVVHKHH